MEAEDETPTDTTRRDRRKRQRADREVDTHDELPTAGLDPVWTVPDDALDARPAAPSPDAEALRERECERLHGMSCRRYQAWLQTRELACREDASGRECPAEDTPDVRGRETPRVPAD